MFSVGAVRIFIYSWLYACLSLNFYHYHNFKFHASIFVAMVLSSTTVTRVHESSKLYFFSYMHIIGGHLVGKIEH